MKRRDFLNISSKMAAAAPFILNSVPMKAFSPRGMQMSSCAETQDRILVIIQLGGGNDGLNTVIPYVDPDYIGQRPNLGITIPNNSDMIIDNSDLAFQPGCMEPIRNLWNDGKASVVQCTGYPNQNRSHFVSTDHYLLGGSETETYESGWMARLFEDQAMNAYPYINNPQAPMLDPLGIQLGNRKPSLGFYSPDNYGCSANLSKQDLAQYYTQTNGIFHPSVTHDCTHYNEGMAYLTQVENSMGLYAERLTCVFNAGSNTPSIDYTNGGDLGNQLKTIARLVDGGCRTRIYHVYIGGFDTHVNQLSRHKQLLGELSQSVKAFMDDMEALGHGDKAVAVTFSEFGRTLDERGTGTDHGTIAPMLIFGEHVIKQVLGDNPVLSDLDNGAPKAPISDPNNLGMGFKDYRWVLGSLLRQWLGVYIGALDHLNFHPFMQEPDCVNTSNNNTSSCFTKLELIDPDYVPAFADQCEFIGPGDQPSIPPSCDGNRVDNTTGSNSISPSVTVLNPKGNDSSEEVAETDAQRDFLQHFNNSNGFDSLKAFPNPFSSRLTVSIKPEEGEENIQFSIIDTKGRMVETRLMNKNEMQGHLNFVFDGSHLVNGIYYVAYTSEKRHKTFKVVKVR